MLAAAPINAPPLDDCGAGRTLVAGSIQGSCAGTTVHIDRTAPGVYVQFVPAHVTSGKLVPKFGITGTGGTGK